jgi:hypothetical protein
MSARSSDEVSLSGYLYKKTRDGRWQKRWFETSGVYLTYYKSKKMEKLLAALSLPQVRIYLFLMASAICFYRNIGRNNDR